MIKLIILALLIPVLGNSQSSKKYELSGEIHYLSTYQGGVDDPNEYLPSPKANVELYIVELIDGKIPKKVERIVSDKAGIFSVKLLPGKYGFVLKEDLDSLITDQFLPKGWSKGGMMESSSSYWVISGNEPIVIVESDKKNIVITNYERSVCNLCP